MILKIICIILFIDWLTFGAWGILWTIKWDMEEKLDMERSCDWPMIVFLLMTPLLSLCAIAF